VLFFCDSHVLIYCSRQGYKFAVVRLTNREQVLFAVMAILGFAAQPALALDFGSDVSERTPFELNPAELAPLHFSRDKVLNVYEEPTVASHQTRFSFRLKPGQLDFSREGGYGVSLLGRPELDVHSSRVGQGRLDETIKGLNQGFAYSAGVKLEHEDAQIDGTAYVSSSLLGLSYGRLGRLWYGGIDVNIERFADEHDGDEHPDQLSFDLTTGRRLGFTGLSASSPLWLLSLQGNLNMPLDPTLNALDDADPDWYLNPSLFWQHPGFTFSAQMQLPVELEQTDDDTEIDYRLRAIFEKRKACNELIAFELLDANRDVIKRRRKPGIGVSTAASLVLATHLQGFNLAQPSVQNHLSLIDKQHGLDSTIVEYR